MPRSPTRSDEVIRIPDLGEYLTAILATVPLQLLAYHVAVLPRAPTSTSPATSPRASPSNRQNRQAGQAESSGVR